jgi:hypothetical protein
VSTAPPPSSAAPPAPPATAVPPAARVERDGWPLPAWPWWIGPVALVGGLVTTIFAASILVTVAGLSGRSHTPAWVDLVSTFFQDIALVVCAVGLASLRGRPRPADFGLRRPPLRLAVGWAAAGAAAYVVFNLIYASLVHTKAKEQLPSKLGADHSTVALVAVVVLVCVIAPVAEETLFRGTFFPALWRRFGLWWGLIPTALAFGLVHAASAPIAFLPILAFLGLVLCLVRYLTASLLPCVALHATNNAVVISTLEHWSVAGGLALVVGANLAVLAALLPLARRPAAATPLAGSTAITQ